MKNASKKLIFDPFSYSGKEFPKNRTTANEEFEYMHFLLHKAISCYNLAITGKTEKEKENNLYNCENNLYSIIHILETGKKFNMKNILKINETVIKLVNSILVYLVRDTWKGGIGEYNAKNEF
jgi:hypothetical protein